MDRYRPGIQNTTHPKPWVAGPYSFGKPNSIHEGEFIAIAHHNMEDLKRTFHSYLDALAGSPGVYYHMRHRTELQEKPHFYAGKAHHLSVRGGDQRIIDKNLVIFIRKKKEKMDENWRQHLEYLMIKHLRELERHGHITVENAQGERPSDCRDREQQKIENFFEELKSQLTKLDVFCMQHAKQKRIQWKAEKPIPITIRIKGKGIKVDGELYPSSKSVLICKGSHISFERKSMKNTHYDEKKRLIARKILVESKHDGEKTYKFKQDYLLNSKTQAANICLGENQFIDHDWNI
jgi:hypothetical protein